MGTGARRAPLLLVEDDELLLRSLERLFREEVDLVIAKNVREAREVLESNDALRGAVIDIGLPDGSGMEALETVRPARPLLPVLFLTALCDDQLVNRAFALRARYLCKPASPQALVDFVVETGIAGIVPPGPLRGAVEELSKQSALTPIEAEIVSHAACEHSLREIAAALGISPETLDTHVERILAKSGHTSLREVGRALRKNAA